MVWPIELSLREINLFKKTFCPSPWFHLRINPQGNYEYCRWAKRAESYPDNISEVDPQTYFQKNMSDLRTMFLNGEEPPGCRECFEQERHNKISGRLRQLLKIGVLPDHFEKSLLSSEWLDEFRYSQLHNGNTRLSPVDWQIDLGNYCNSACLFCHPIFSSRLASDWKELGLLEKVPDNTWCEDATLIQSLLELINNTPSVKYLHFIGGETLITPAFKIFLQSLVDSGRAKTATIGFTTNLTVWRDDVVALLREFDGLNLGLSIESLHVVNNYARWPSQIEVVRAHLDRWVALAKELNWLVQLRVTPTLLTIKHLDTLYEYAMTHNLSIESCNFLARPECLRANVLPLEHRLAAASKLRRWINQQTISAASQKIINTRNPSFAKEQLVQDAQSYVDFLENAEDESFRIADLVQYLKSMETLHQNSILDVLPEYEDFLRAAGY